MTEQHLIEMAALGRRFQLGDFYNYRNDRILSYDSKLDRELHTTKYDPIKLKFQRDCNSTSTRECIGLEAHLQASVTTGIINCKYRGASNYLNDHPDPALAKRTLLCRVKSRKECLAMQPLSDEINILNLSSDQSEATHVVFGVTYGAEIYCVLTQGVTLKTEDFDKALEKDEEHLSKLIAKMENALVDAKTLAEFKKQFTEEDERRVKLVKCRIYSDFQRETVRHCGLFDAYLLCLQLINNVANGKLVPIRISLRPLRVGGAVAQYRDVDADLVTRCVNLWNDLDLIVTKSKARLFDIDKNCQVALLHFIDSILKYMKILRKSLKKGVLQARDGISSDGGDLERAIVIAEDHKIFGPSRLERWLNYKEAEAELFFKMAAIKFVPSKKQLIYELVYSLGTKHALVLSIPPMDQATNEMLKAMSHHVRTHEKLTPFEQDVINEDHQHHQLLHKRILGKIWELRNHVERNKHLENKANFFIMTEDSISDCRFFIYKADDLLKENLDRLPTPPTGLIGIKKSSSIQLEWEYSSIQEIPCCQFTVQFRLKGAGNGSWMEKKTGETWISIDLERGAAKEIRVAAETCVGRSEFSEIFDTESDDAVEPNPPITDIFLQYSQLVEKGSPSIYMLNAKVKWVEGKLRWFDIGSPSTTSQLNRKFIILMGGNKKMLINGILNYILGVQWKDPFRFKCVPEEQEPFTEHSVTAYTIHHREGMVLPYSITIIDMPGYKDIGEFETNDKITRNIYKFLTDEEIRIDEIHAACYVVASNDDDTIEEHRHKINRFLKIFAKDFKDSTRLLVTFENHADATVLDAIGAAYTPDRCPSLSGVKCNKINCTLLYASNRNESPRDGLDLDQLFWNRGQDNFVKFFSMLDEMDGKDLKSTRQVIQYRQQLEQLLKRIGNEITPYLSTMEDAEVCRMQIEECRQMMEENKNYFEETTETLVKKVMCTQGFVAYNCRFCQKTCETPKPSSFFDKFRTSSCTSTSCNCLESEHEYQPFEWRVTNEIKVIITQKMKSEYDFNCLQKIRIQEQLRNIYAEMNTSKGRMLNLFHELNTVISSLKSTALLSDVLAGPVDYLSLIWIKISELIKPNQYHLLDNILDELKESLNSETFTQL